MAKPSLSQQISENLAHIKKTVDETVDLLRQLDMKISQDMADFVSRLESQAAFLVGGTGQRPTKARSRKPSGKAAPAAKQAVRTARQPKKSKRVVRAKPTAQPVVAEEPLEESPKRTRKAKAVCDRCGKLLQSNDPEQQCQCGGPQP